MPLDQQTPFRELFVELAPAVLDVLRGMLEQAISGCAARHGNGAFRPSRLGALVDAVHRNGRVIADQLGVSEVGVWRSGHDETVVFVGDRPCRKSDHRVTVRISEHAVMCSDHPAHLLLEAVCNAAQQPCSCELSRPGV